MRTNPIRICEECRSAFNSEASKMAGLCPECSHVLYGYENCQHEFKEGKCIKCSWDGRVSEHVKRLKWGDKQELNGEGA